MSKKVKKKYTTEFKEEAIKLVTKQGYAIAEAGRNLGVHPNLLGKWKRDAEEVNNNGLGELGGKAAVTKELRRLRAENKRLVMEREILKKAAAFFAKESN